MTKPKVSWDTTMFDKKCDEMNLSTINDPGSLRIESLLQLMIEAKASDLHLTSGSPPAFRVYGEVLTARLPVLTGKDTKRLAYQVLTEKQRDHLEKDLELDFSFGVKGLARFRGNCFFSKGNVSAVFRLIPSVIPDFNRLGLPQVLLDITDVPNGLILVTGPTGSGKSTTLAALIDRLNQKEHGHIITFEDPIEFVHTHRSCIVNQREVGGDTHSFSKALRTSLRQDPDIILVGELRDLETMEAALTMAETGHLVFGTLHTNSCVQTINRVINVFPSHQQDQVRTLLSFVLQGVVSQQLISKSYEPGRVLALEIMIPTPAIRNLMREGKIHQLYSSMQVGQDKSGMMTMNQCLHRLVEKKIIDAETAMAYSTMPEELGPQLGLKARG